MGMDPSTDVGCYDTRGRDLRTYYAGFTRRPMPDEAIIALSWAGSVFPDAHPGYMAWLTTVTQTDMFAARLTNWAVALGRTIAGARIRRARTRVYCEAWAPEWGRRAAIDGVILALFGRGHIPGAAVRAEEFGIARETYSKIRDFVGGSLILATNQYEDSLQWVVRHRVSKRLSGTLYDS
jgi:hypothetical protein